MSTVEPSFTVGIEEEYLLVDRATRALASDPPAELLRMCQDSRPGEVSPEFLRCQIEIGTPVCGSIAEARKELVRLRRTVADNAAEFGLAPLAASTHPFAEWDEQPHTDKERYNELAETMQVVARRLLICGMHVHVAVEDEALRIDLLSQLSYFLPHLLALSTSSPFWRGRKTGLHSYRLAVFNELPRTGLPDTFASPGEYQRTIDILVKAGLIEDGTKIWWDLRPSARFPTLEMRISDVCTRLDDAVAIAALFRCITRMLWRLRRNNQRWRQYPSFLIDQNRWLAQRDGVSGGPGRFRPRGMCAVRRPDGGNPRADARGRRIFRLSGSGRACPRHHLGRNVRRPPDRRLQHGFVRGRDNTRGARTGRRPSARRVARGMRLNLAPQPDALDGAPGHARWRCGGRGRRSA